MARDGFEALNTALDHAAAKARLIGSDAMTRARLGFPFPLPQNGVEVMWNHRTRYRGDSFVGITSQAVVSTAGVSSRNKGYDQPYYGSEGLYFIDMIDMYNGAFDRYVWKLVGKRELYIPYNAYRMSDGSFKNDQLLQHPHVNQDAARYELHRVWMIEATEREGKNHAFGKRVFYVDEDSWNVVLVENYDPQGKPWRFQEGHLLNAYDIQSTNSFPIVTYDLKESRYFIHRLLAEDPPLQFNIADMDDQEFLPAAVKRKYSK